MDAPVQLLRQTLLFQHDMAWQLACHHLDTLTTEECLWRPADAGLHVVQHADGSWVADWPTTETYDLGPSSMAWLTWHLGFWWSMVLNHGMGPGTLERHHVTWPGTAEGVRAWVRDLHRRWVDAVGALSNEELASPARTRWPFQDRPFADVVAWSTVELTKSAAELGYARFLYARRAGRS